MTPSRLAVARAMALDTFRQSIASRLFWLMLGAGALAIVLCLSVGVEGGAPGPEPGEREVLGGNGQPRAGVDTDPGHLTLAFGAMRVRLFREPAAMVDFLKVLLAKWAAGLVGTLLAVIWTAGFLPDAIRPSSASVLLAKPVSRTALLLGKYAGVMLLVTFQSVFFVGGTWLALGLRTGSWDLHYLLGVPILVLNFAILYSASTLLAVWTRNTAACVFGAILFWALCLGVNSARYAGLALPALAGDDSTATASIPRSIEVAYWVLPKPVDLAMILDDALGSSEHFDEPAAFTIARNRGAFHPWASVASSLLCAAALLAVSARHFSTTDY